VLAAEGASQQLCEAAPNRIFIRHSDDTACLAYFATSGQEEKRRAVIFFDGDSKPDQYADTAGREQRLKNIQRNLQGLAARLKVRIVRIARLGLDGSSGNHADRRKPKEIHIMNAAVDALKARLGIDDIVLAGQSRGSLIAASLLTLGRKDVTCAVLGSGVFEHANYIHQAVLKGNPHAKVKPGTFARHVYDPSIAIGAIAADPKRRIFILGDPQDAQVPFDQQQRFARAIGKAGHHVRLFEIDAYDEKQHGAVKYVMPAAAHCANGADEKQIASIVSRVRQNLARGAAEAAAKAAEAKAKAKPADKTEDATLH
jgi:predicted esterase